MPFYGWSKTSATNASSDSSINWAEGMAPSAVNDSGRAMMSGLAKYRDDVAGSITTGGTNTAYTMTSNQGFTSKAVMNGQMVTFAVHATSGLAPSLNVDSLGGSSLVANGGHTLFAGVLRIGTPYSAVYSSGVDEWFLLGYVGEPNTIATVASLPSAVSYVGYRFIVNDANATTFHNVVAGGGANTVPVFSDGTNWVIG